MDALSSFSVGKPHVLFAIFLILPALIFVIAKIRKFEKSISAQENKNAFKSLKLSLTLRTLFRCLAWIASVLAFAEISFGSKKIPVHKSGSNVTFVFDISYSMLAKDAPSRLSRLDAVKIYASSLVENLSSTSFSAVLAKGDGFAAVSETEDKNAMLNLIENLSPHLMTSQGSSLARGIETAITSLPSHSAKSQYIWVFTDGDETDNLLEKSLDKTHRFGIPVTFVGFGSEKESEIIAGDGKTKVNTALRANRLKKICEASNEKSGRVHTMSKEKASYVDSQSQSSAWQLMSQIKQKNNDGEENTLSYEIQNVRRHSFFLLFAVIFLMLSFIVGELKISPILNKKNTGKKSAFLILNFSLLLSLLSCSSERKELLEGSWAWYEGKYTAATADFLNVVQDTSEDSLSHEYAIFDLSTTYLALGESEAALDRLSEIRLESEDLPKELRSAAFYNMGMIYARRSDYNKAAQFFKKAILANQKNMNAKINLELCEREIVQKQANEAQAQMQGVNEEKQKHPDMKNEIFNLIRENEGKKWRNMSDGGEKNNDVIDY